MVRTSAIIERTTEPHTALRPLKGLVAIDEIQRRPDLFPLLQVLARNVEAVPLSQLVNAK